MRLVSWNVNGLRAVLKKELFYPTFEAFGADVFAIQETKMHPEQATLAIPASYTQTWSSAERKGYSGTAVFSKEKPHQTIHTLGLQAKDALGFGLSDPAILDTEGRLCALEFESFWFVNCYTPNAQDGLARINLRLAWGTAFTRFVLGLAEDKPVVICGDLNVAHNEIDLARPGPNRGNAGFSDEERTDFQSLLDAGFIDSFRYLYPDEEEAYSWWSFRGNARNNNTGWRIDYFLVSDCLRDAISEAAIWPEVEGSDHCPVSLDLDV
ncbi:MAG: exodeoxyribonuclease III [Coriobacteriales bacterium]|jgi:exodeoxyribonuclease-3|nr:exodeoxyribonuclease III [Coriobacteriales bacterium]